MSSYRGAGGLWDGGPPGAEAEYATQQHPTPYAQQPARAMPSTDPWTGVSYSQYGQSSNFHYSQYNSGYNYNYENNYYQRADGNYMNYGTHSSHTPYPQRPSSYNYPQQRSISPSASKNYETKRSYKSKSRSVSPYEKRDRAYSSGYEDRRRDRSRSRNKKNKRYLSSDSSRSKSRSPSQLSNRKVKKSRSPSSNSSDSDSTYKNKKYNKSRGRNSSRTPPFKRSPDNRSSSGTPNKDSLRSMSHRCKSIDKKSRDSKKYSEKKPKTKKHRKDRDSSSPSKGYKKGDKPIVKIERPSVTPPRSYLRRESSLTPPRNKQKDRKFDTPPRKEREATLTPPKSYNRMRSTSSSGTPSRSPTPKHSTRKHSSTPDNSRSSSSESLHHSRSKKRKSLSRSRSRSKSHSRRRSKGRSRSKSRRRSKSKGKGRRSRSRSHSVSSHSKSRSGSPSEDERRGQFTVADRKRYWKLQRSKQVKWEPRTPPKEIKPPPGVIEQTDVDDIEYGDPPEVEGPNFAELLHPPDQSLSQPSGSKSKSIPIPIKNDGSFLEMFKKMQEETKKAEVDEKKTEMKKPVLPFIGKRRGGRVLKTGLVKKAKAIDEQSVDNTPKDAWSLYMQEVKKYRETSCEEERKTRPLVK